MDLNNICSKLKGQSAAKNAIVIYCVVDVVSMSQNHQHPVNTPNTCDSSRKSIFASVFYERVAVCCWSVCGVYGMWGGCCIHC